VTSASEARVQSAIRLEAPGRGVRLWRNNVGVLTREDGTPVRFGLANETAALNRELKSGDLIGWRRRLITVADVGFVIAQFVSRECKPEGWMLAPPTDQRRYAHEQAQLRWIELINADGGDAGFATGVGTL
jgi:hypothetical protein